jgi:RNA polymerase sigma factor (sigma-70 family)
MVAPQEQREVTDLVRSAVDGDQNAWREIVRRYLPLVWSVARSHRLGSADAADVTQRTWIRLTEQLVRLRDPERLPAWLATTARRESWRVQTVRRRELPTDRIEDTPEVDGPESQAMRSARDRVLWQAFATLTERCQRLLGILARAPELTYAQVGNAIGMPLGSIGPTRKRCLDVLRRRLIILDLHEEAR